MLRQPKEYTLKVSQAQLKVLIAAMSVHRDIADDTVLEEASSLYPQTDGLAGGEQVIDELLSLSREDLISRLNGERQETEKRINDLVATETLLAYLETVARGDA